MKLMQGGSSSSITYSPPRGTVLIVAVPGGGNGGIYETPFDTTSPTTDLTQAYALSGYIIKAHPTLQYLYGASSSIGTTMRRRDLTLPPGTTGETSYNSFNPYVETLLFNLDITQFFAISDSALIRAPIDTSGNVGTRTSVLTGNGFSARGAAFMPGTGSLWIVKYSSSLTTVSLVEYNSTGTSVLSSRTLPIPSEPGLWTNFVLGPNRKWYCKYRNSIQTYDMDTDTISLLAGDPLVGGNVDGSRAAARFQSIGCLSYESQLGKLILIDNGYLKTITLPGA
jgi:hypothetical protein